MQRANISNRAATAGRFWKHSEFILSFEICLRSLWLLKTQVHGVLRGTTETRVPWNWNQFQQPYYEFCFRLNVFKDNLKVHFMRITTHWFSCNSLPCLTAGVLFHLNKSGYSVARLSTRQYPGIWPTSWYQNVFWRVRGGVFFLSMALPSKCAKSETFVWIL